MIKKIVFMILTFMLFILEGVVSMWLPLPNGFQFVPYFVFSMLMLLVFQFQGKWIVAVLVLFGMSYDILYSPYYLLFLIIYLVGYIVIRQIEKIFFINFWVRLIFILVGIIIIDLILYMINSIQIHSNDVFLDYVSHRLGVSLLINTAVIGLLYMMIQFIIKIKWKKAASKASLSSYQEAKTMIVKRLK